MANNDVLTIEAVSRGPILYVRLRGPIDETFNIDDIANAGIGHDVIINTAAVNRISSFGVRQWVNGMERLSRTRNRILLLDCSPVVVKQANMVANFAERCDIASVRAPYFCEKCSWETTVELAVTEQGIATPDPPPTCRRCSASMELDEHPASYFRFARPERFRAPEPHVKEFIESYVRGGAKKDVKSAGLELLGRGWERVLHDRRIWAAAGGGLVVVLLMVVIASSGGPTGVAPEALREYHNLIADKRFTEAAAKVEQMQGEDGLPADLAATMKAALEEQSELAFSAALGEGRKRHGARDYQGAIDAFTAAERIAAVPNEVAFTMAECHRRLGHNDDALKRYAAFIEALPRDSQDRQLDDAMFWSADLLVKQNKTQLAIPMLERVIEMPSSNYRRSSRRLLKKIRD